MHYKKTEYQLTSTLKSWVKSLQWQKKAIPHNHSFQVNSLDWNLILLLRKTLLCHPNTSKVLWWGLVCGIIKAWSIDSILTNLNVDLKIITMHSYKCKHMNIAWEYCHCWENLSVTHVTLQSIKLAAGALALKRTGSCLFLPGFTSNKTAQ